MIPLKNRDHFSLIYSGGFAQMVPKPVARPENRHQAKPRYGMENPVCEYYSRFLHEENIRMGFGHGEARHLHAKNQDSFALRKASNSWQGTHRGCIG
ncbi:MAG: hypothetical protein O7B79_07715 [SAR324 cluster bacterium]|nr:hypothetical protein [SAR324 cluster bacterium]